MASRTESDEFYVMELCDAVLGVPGSRQHRFDWLRGDWSESRQSYSYLPVDGYWDSLQLVVEYAERQHTQSVTLFDNRATVSGVTRGMQRRIYDDRRARDIPANGLRLLVIPASSFSLRKHKIQRQWLGDVETVRGLFQTLEPKLPGVV